MARIDDLIKEQEKKLKPKTDANIAEYTKENNALKEQVNASLDASAEASAGVYRQEIEQAPLDSRIQYDKNAMREAVDRKKIQESLANMGMTDSGLSSSMQTALTVQKSRADNQVRVAEQQRIRAAENMIDQIFANNEQQKALKGIEIDQDTAAYARTQRENATALATQTATSMYNTEVEAAAKVQAAQVKAEQDWMQKQLSGQQDTAKLRSDYVKMLMTREDNPLDADAAWKEAYRAYPNTPAMSQAQYGYYTHYLQQGYGSAYANAMSQAYDKVMSAGGKEASANAAATSAMIATAAEEVSRANINLKNGAQIRKVLASAQPASFGPQPLTAPRQLETYDLSAEHTATILSDNTKALADKPMSEIGKMYAAACMTGYAYTNILTDANAQQIGEALARNLSGIYLEIALSAAGLE